MDESRLASAFKALCPHAAVGSAISAAVAEGRLSGVSNVRQVCLLSGVAQARAAEAMGFLGAAAKLGLVERVSELNWRIRDKELFTQLMPMLWAVHIYRSEVHSDADRVDVVLTKPPNPSHLTQVLSHKLLGTWGLLDTREVLPSVAERAVTRFAVMTPFLDEVGADILIALFRQASSSAEKQLILRATPEGHMPPGYFCIESELRAMNTDVFNFRLEKAEATGTETFHAKVVLADDKTAYVGSSNMTKWSFQYSLELGLLVTGRAASRIAQIVDAAVAVSAKVA